jgi:hypothetical protein
MTAPVPLADPQSADRSRGVQTVVRSIVGAVQRHRRWWLGLAGLIFVVGCVASLRKLDFDVSDLRALPTAIILVIFGPIFLLYGALGLQRLSRGSGFALSFTHAFRVNCAAQLAEILPLPGGAIVRTGALVAAGAGAGRSAALVMLGAFLWVGLAAGAAGIALLELIGDERFIAVIVVSAIALVVTLVQLAKLTGKGVAMLLLAHRAVGCVLIAARLVFAFAAIGTPLPVATAFIFTLATIAGSAAAIAPAGFGVSELFGAAIATAIGIDPFAAFLAIALNRVLGIISNGAIFAVLEAKVSLSGRPQG